MKTIIYHRCIFVLIVAGFFATEKGTCTSTCNKHFVDTVTDDKLTASSIYSTDYTADKAKLSSTGWSPDKSEADPWIQVDLGWPSTIVAVVTKGLNFKNLIEYVKQYIVRYSNTTSSWSTVQNGTTYEFIANSDTTTPVTNVLPSRIVARYIRLYPTESYDYRSLRFDVIGCEVATTTSSTLTVPLATTTLRTQTSTTTSYLRTNSITLSTRNTNTTLSLPANSSIMTMQTNTTALPSATTSTTSSSQTSTTNLSLTTTSITSSTPNLYSTLSSKLFLNTSTDLNTPTTANTLLESTLFNNAQAGLCTCSCAQTNFAMTQQDVQAKIENIVQKLTVSKKKTSKYIRSKTSAQDTRPEVVYVGFVAIIILCVFASLIIIPDLCTMFRFFYLTLKGNK